MMILGIDTTARTCSVALYDDRLLAVRSVTDGPTHSQLLIPFVKEVMEETGVAVNDLDCIAVSVGPGSFTGLRIGISAVKGLAFPFRIPCAGVSTLEALAMNLRGMEGSVVCPVMDARRGEFYHALFRIESSVPVRLSADCAISGEEIAKELASYSNVFVVGDGAVKFSQLFPEFSTRLAPPDLLLQNAESVAILGNRDAAEGKLIPCEKLSPVYLRLPQAEREWLAKNNNKN